MVVIRKAAACVVRARGGEPELLVFDHPTAGVQIPKGGVEPGEDPATAALRELAEESGIADARLVEALAPIGLVEGGVRQIWYPWIVTADDLPDAWDHVAQGSSDERGLVFRFRWVPVERAGEELTHPSFAPVAQAVIGSAFVANRLWAAKVDIWDDRVGDDGDVNRRLNSDPVLWHLLGAVDGHDVLDAGCGTGYLAAKLAAAGARVVAVDTVPEMLVRARRRASRAEVRLDDAQRLDSCPDEAFDAVVSNYVLMDLPDLDAACAAMHRVLRRGGRAVVVVSHPCFCFAERLDDHTLRLDGSYFDRGPRSQRWGPFDTRFVYWHRTLSDYLGAFARAGLHLDAIEEPIVAPDAPVDPSLLARYRVYPFSMAVRLRR